VACARRLLLVRVEIMVATVMTVATLPTVRELPIVWAADTTKGTVVRSKLDLGRSWVVSLPSTIS
jgi:hypothetical protein